MILDEFDTPRKRIVRQKWYAGVIALAKQRGRKLNGLWLAANDFSDLLPIAHLFKNIIVPENDRNCGRFSEKKRHLREVPQVKLVRGNISSCLRWIVDMDVCNFDYCTHLNLNVLDDLVKVLKPKIILPGGLLFMTLSYAGGNAKSTDPRQKRLVSSSSGASAAISNYWGFRRPRSGVQGLPMEYAARGERGWMVTYGWKLQ